jgi:hypothetical protein
MLGAGTVPEAGTFYAVPLVGQGPPESGAGEWECTTDDRMDFSLTIAARDGSIRLDILGEQSTQGTYRDGILTAELTSEGDHVPHHRPIPRDTLTGGWREAGCGTFTCRKPAAERWRESRALVPLYFYEGKYTTEPKPGAKPIARVWCNPTAMLALDREIVEEL